MKPSIHPLFKIKTEEPNHNHKFKDASGTEENQLPTLNSAKSMAMTAIDVACDPLLLTKIKQSFEKSK